MYQLNEITPADLSAMFNERLAADIEIPAAVAKFKEQVPDVDFSQPKEVAPSPIVLGAEGLAQAVVYGGNDLAGKYLRLVLSVYALGGKIHYTELSTGNYKAAISWPAL